MEAQGDEGTVRHRRKFVVLGTALPAASEARHSGHRLAPTGKGLPTRLPRSGLVQYKFMYITRFSGFFGTDGAHPKFVHGVLGRRLGRSADPAVSARR